MSDKAPAAWSLVTIDLFKDFGERTLTGIAFTIHGGAGSFDHVYLGRTIDDLDRIDVGNVGGKLVDLQPEELQRLWQELDADDASVAYRAFWRMVAGRERTVEFIKSRLPNAQAASHEDGKLSALIRNLDSDTFAIREDAFAELKKNLAAATPLLKAHAGASRRYWAALKSWTWKGTATIRHYGSSTTFNLQSVRGIVVEGDDAPAVATAAFLRRAGLGRRGNLAPGAARPWRN